MGILETVRRFGRGMNSSGFRFGRPLVLLQSDDWGRVGVRDEDGREELRAAGLELGERPYDFYSLETAEDVGAVAEMLEGVRDSVDEPACLEMNFVTANVDFAASHAQDCGKIILKCLSEGLPGKWQRPGLFEAYREGIKKRVLRASLHGATHFCQHAVAESFARGGERAHLLRILWKAETPYIHWRMPWVGYEYWNPEREPENRFLEAHEQRYWIGFAAEAFESFFGCRSVSACAPGYRANESTARCWQEQGVRIAQNGPGAMRLPKFDEFGLLHTYRSGDFEPALTPRLRVEEMLQSARKHFSAGVPFIVSAHSINFHSTLAPFRERTLPLLRELLCGLKKIAPEVLFVNSAKLLEIIETGGYETSGGRLHVSVHGQATEVRV